MFNTFQPASSLDFKENGSSFFFLYAFVIYMSLILRIWTKTLALRSLMQGKHNSPVSPELV